MGGMKAERKNEPEPPLTIAFDQEEKVFGASFRPSLSKVMRILMQINETIY